MGDDDRTVDDDSLRDAHESGAGGEGRVQLGEGVRRRRRDGLEEIGVEDVAGHHAPLGERGVELGRHHPPVAGDDQRRPLPDTRHVDTVGHVRGPVGHRLVGVEVELGDAAVAPDLLGLGRQTAVDERLGGRHAALTYPVGARQAGGGVGRECGHLANEGPAPAPAAMLPAEHTLLPAERTLNVGQ